MGWHLWAKISALILVLSGLIIELLDLFEWWGRFAEALGIVEMIFKVIILTLLMILIVMERPKR